MIRKDYIQRYFDELAKVLAAALLLKKNHKATEAEAMLNDFSTDFLGISLAEILTLEVDLIKYLIKEKNFTLDHFKLLEDLLYHKYLINVSNNKLKKITLEVLNYVSKNDANYSLQRMNRIKELS
ncbi:MAG: hypothetical protein ACPGSL_02440 [Vicingaceae bacterium]